MYMYALFQDNKAKDRRGMQPPQLCTTRPPPAVAALHGTTTAVRRAETAAAVTGGGHLNCTQVKWLLSERFK